MKNLLFFRSIVVLIILIQMTACGRYNHYSFEKKAEFDVNDIAGTSKIINVYEMRFEGELDARCRGALLALFGEPHETSTNSEDAYNYVINATNKDGNTCILTAYQGASSSAIGGNNDEITKQAANELAALIRSTAPADFEAIVYYADTDSKITYGCKNGVPYYHEEQPVVAPWILDAGNTSGI